MTNLNKSVPAFKITEEMHRQILALAGQSHRKVLDQIRYLLELGLPVAHAIEDSRSGHVKNAIEQACGHPQKNKGERGRERKAS